jgi:hypothetical protein
MKAQRREVNIFNMSLLDILCGALGAFCFLMLALLPFWKPEGLNNEKIPDLRKEAAELREKLARLGAPTELIERVRQLDIELRKALAAKKETAELQRQLEELKKQLANMPPDVREQFEKLQREYARLQAAIDEQKRLAQDAQAQAAELARQLEAMKKDLAPGLKEQFEKQQEILRRTQEAQRAAEEKAQALESRLGQAEKQRNMLQDRLPFTSALTWTSANHDLDIYVRFVGNKPDGTPRMDPVDPLKAQPATLTGDYMVNCLVGPCTDLWTMRDMPVQSEYEVHIKFIAANGNPAPALVRGVFLTYEGKHWRMPTKAMPQEQTSMLLGNFRVNAKRELEFAIAPEFLAEFKAANPKETNYYTK